jgi:hypothetical protein
MQFREQFLLKRFAEPFIRPNSNSPGSYSTTVRQIISLVSLSADIDTAAGGGQLSDREVSCIRDGRS